MPKSDPRDPTYLKITARPNKRYLVQRWLESSGFGEREEHTVVFVYYTIGVTEGRGFAIFTAIVSSKDVGAVYYELWFDSDTGESYIREIDPTLDGEKGSDALAVLESFGLMVQSHKWTNQKLTTLDGSPPSSQQLKALFSNRLFHRAMDRDGQATLLVRANTVE